MRIACDLNIRLSFMHLDSASLPRRSAHQTPIFNPRLAAFLSKIAHWDASQWCFIFPSRPARYGRAADAFPEGGTKQLALSLPYCARARVFMEFHRMYGSSAASHLRVEVKHRSPAPKRYTWEIFHDDKVLSVKESRDQFGSWEEASQAGRDAMKKLSRT
jgi:hypothetical protein